MKNYIYQNKWDTYKTTLNKIHGTEYVLHYFFFNLYWSVIASRYCVSFCCTTK